MSIEDKVTNDRVRKREFPKDKWLRCPGCKAAIFRKEADKRLGVCPECNYHFFVSARQRIEQVLDEGTFEPWDEELMPTDPLEFVDSKPYKDRLVEEQSGSVERRDRILNNRFYQRIADSLSGTHEYMAMERLYELYARTDYRAFNRGFGARYDRYEDFLVRHGLAERVNPTNAFFASEERRTEDRRVNSAFIREINGKLDRLGAVYRTVGYALRMKRGLAQVLRK